MKGSETRQRFFNHYFSSDLVEITPVDKYSKSVIPAQAHAR
ncbi:hypothetical protein D1AOALGA4SA_11505 [Olavius algarvensis Delta 1 endosymbiont]|nr:hypothetical protein D1AOALGA4SA_11505 [Olavius algarvensis Delta 1 endosymbiont]